MPTAYQDFLAKGNVTNGASINRHIRRSVFHRGLPDRVRVGEIADTELLGQVKINCLFPFARFDLRLQNRLSVVLLGNRDRFWWIAAPI